MQLCADCEKLPYSKIMGDGYCDKHKMVYPFYRLHDLKEKCPYCAKEKGICQLCGKEVPTTDVK